MESHGQICCRVVACREALDDGKQWSFYLINDGDNHIDSAKLYGIDYEWGDFGNSEAADMRVAGLAPGDHALIWRDGGSGVELRMELSVRVRVPDRVVRLHFEFPKLYRKTNLPVIECLGKPGWEVVARG